MFAKLSIYFLIEQSIILSITLPWHSLLCVFVFARVENYCTVDVVLKKTFGELSTVLSNRTAFQSCEHDFKIIYSFTLKYFYLKQSIPLLFCWTRSDFEDRATYKWRIIYRDLLFFSNKIKDNYKIVRFAFVFVIKPELCTRFCKAKLHEQLHQSLITNF